MIQEVLMPKLGQTMEEATVETWHKKEGDKVERGDVILEITTDKATLEVESYVSGVMRKALAAEGVTLPVNTVIALVGEPDDPMPDNLAQLEAAARGEGAPVSAQASAPAAEAETEPAPAAEAPAAAPTETPAPTPPAGRILISPRARKLAKAEKVPIEILKGSGPKGRITEKDVRAYLERRKEVKVTPAAKAIAKERGIDVLTVKGSGPGGKITREDILAAAAAPAAAAVEAAPAAMTVPGGKRIPLTAMQRIVAKRMAQSKREAPHFYLTMEIDMTEAVKLRAKLNASGSIRVAFHDFLIRACAKAFTENPAMNAAWAGDAIVQRNEINIGVAVALEGGLIVPVVRNADRLSLTGTAEKSRELIEKARSKKLTPDEYEGGCFTISNLGMFDVDNFVAVINPGESAILGLGRIAQKPVVIGGGIQVRAMMGCSLSADHRAVNGAIAAAFLKRAKDLLESPDQLT